METHDFGARLTSIESKLDSIAEAITAIAVQDEKIIHLSSSVSKLWQKQDEQFGQEGIIATISRHQASCPRETVEKINARVWGLVLGLLIVAATAVVGLIK